MRSHIHELWEDLELSPQYPEPDLDRVMDRVMDQIEAEEPEHPASQTRRRRPMHKKKLLLSLAAALVVLTGSAVAVANHYGVLDLFFTGDTSQLEPYVQTDLGSAENEDYRFTVNSAYYDGMTVYATVTVEGLNEQAVEDLKSNKVIAECHREVWGQEMVDGLMKSGSTGPDAIMCNMHAIIMDDGHECSGTGIGGAELPAPSDTSRSWKVDANFDRWLGPLDTPLKIWAGFMGEEYAVEVPLDMVIGSIYLTPDTEVLLNPITGQQATITDICFAPTQLYFAGEWDERVESEAYMEDLGNDWCAVRLKDGTILTASQMERIGGRGSDHNGFYSYGDLGTVPTSDISNVASIIIGNMEFPADGSDPIPVDSDLHLAPFLITYPLYPDREGVHRCLRSFRQLCEGLGADYTWNDATQTATAIYRGITVQVPVNSTQITIDGQAVELTYVTYDQNGDEITLPNPTEPSELEQDVLVDVGTICDAWKVGAVWNGVSDGENTVDQGLIILP